MFSLCLSLCACGAAFADDSTLARKPSEFRAFTDKRGQQIEARILSISDDRRQLKLVRQDGIAFELEITLLSLDDQQFLSKWLDPEWNGIFAGAVKVFGILPGGETIDTDALEGVDDIVSIFASKQGWLVRRSSGEVMSFENRFPNIADVEYLYVNTNWIYGCAADGTVKGGGGGGSLESAITGAVQCVGSNRHVAALLDDGTVKVWGQLYNTRRPIDPPEALFDIVALSATQNRVTAVDQSGKLYSWKAGDPEVFETLLGDGVVEIDAGVFDNIARTRSGAVYTWTQSDVSNVSIPEVLKGEGSFQKVRCNGATFAAQREDGSWLAWGRNSSGIVDHINGLGPVADLAFFSEPGNQELGYVIWR